MAVKAKPDEYFDELETMPTEARQKYQNRKLSRVVKNAYHHAPTVKKIFDKAGVSPAQIGTVKDLEKLPIIRKTDLIEWQRRRPAEDSKVSDERDSHRDAVRMTNPRLARSARERK